jgi:uncharacterized repeat protein (TIGR03837 family)
MSWDLYCHVVDNFGDIGVCWRLAADLASRGERVRLFVDDRSALDWMAPPGAAGVEVCAWPAAGTDDGPGDVVVEAFGCTLPDHVATAIAARAQPPVWINLEYLSAEAYVERSHRLPSPRGGVTTWFFYPGYTPATGGLLREPGLMPRRAAFDGEAWRAAHGLRRADAHERVASLFCYDNAVLPALLDELAQAPTLLLVAPGAAERQVRAALGRGLTRGALRAQVLSHLTQTDFDHLLWSCDLNIVRGEDSWVRAQWAGRPFLWQAYPQPDAAHHAKVEAFLDRHLAGAPVELATQLRAAFRVWNGVPGAELRLPPLSAWQRHDEAWRDTLLAQDDLCTQLLGFVAGKR